MSKSTGEGKIGRRYNAPFKAGPLRMVTQERLSQSQVCGGLVTADSERSMLRHIHCRGAVGFVGLGGYVPQGLM